MTLLELRNKLRGRLNDTTSGWFTDSEIIDCINVAKTEIEGSTGCHLHSQVLSSIDGQADYQVIGVFDPKAVAYTVDGITTAVRQWNLTELTNVMATMESARATPDHWIRISGDTIKLHPKPDTSTGSILVYGFGITPPLVNDNDEVTSIQAAFQNTYLLDRAEAEARKTRMTSQYSENIAVQLMTKYYSWIASIHSMKGLQA